MYMYLLLESLGDDIVPVDTDVSHNQSEYVDEVNPTSSDDVFTCMPFI